MSIFNHVTRSNVPTMRFLCFGAGAIGTYIGGSLALAGHSVVFIERPEQAERLRVSGITLWLDQQPHRLLDPQIVTDLEMALPLGPFDAAILAVKAYDTAALVETLSPYRMALPPVMCFQNGVENEAVITAVLGDDKVISGTVTTAIGKRGTGEIVVERLRGVGLANEHILATSLVAILDGAGLRARQFANAAAMKWSKMFTNLLANASSAILDLPPDAIFAHPGLYAIEVRMLRETLQVMRALTIPVVNLPGTPVRTLAWLVSYLPPRISRPLLRSSLSKGRGAKMPSFHIDLHGGRGKSEVDHLNGAVARFGARCGVPTPVNQVLNDTLMQLTCGEIPLDRYAHKPDQLLKLIK
jgi:2-dehydropantoate 2-reductase